MSSPLEGHVPRRLVSVVKQRLTEEPVIALPRPRSVGKLALLAEIARAQGVGVIDLDDPEVQDAARTNPSASIASAPPVCIDEYQRVPLVIDAIKARLEGGPNLW